MSAIQVQVLLLVGSLAGVFCLPPALDDRISLANGTSARDHEFLKHLHTTRASLGSNFKFKYIGEGGVISSTKHSTGHWFEVAATVAVSETAHQKGAEIISKMTKHMPREIFDNLATHATAGIFTKEEHLSVYPEYKSIADTPQCHQLSWEKIREELGKAMPGRKFLADLNGHRVRRISTYL